MKKYLKADLIYTILSNKFKDELDNYPTALRREKKFKYYLEMVKPKIALEIGTCSGMSAALIAMYAEKVYTIDTQNYPISKEIWEYLGIFEKIVPYVIGTEDRNGEKEKIVKTLEFDFAYIDGAHHYESVKFDFDLVKNKCKKKDQRNCNFSFHIHDSRHIFYIIISQNLKPKRSVITKSNLPINRMILETRVYPKETPIATSR